MVREKMMYNTTLSERRAWNGEEKEITNIHVIEIESDNKEFINEINFLADALSVKYERKEE
jgi:hypothetical protein